jgi:hypothetical protein
MPPFDAILQSEIDVEDPVTQGLCQKIKDNFDAHESAIGTIVGGNLPNPWFEVDDGGTPPMPLNWDVSTLSGGTVVLDGDTAFKGSHALKFTHPGGADNGGGTANSDLAPICPEAPAALFVGFSATNASVRVTFSVDYYDKDKVFIDGSTEILYNKVSVVPMPKTVVAVPLTPPATARYVSATCVMGDTDTDPGSATTIVLGLCDLVTGPVVRLYTPGAVTLIGNDSARVVNSTTPAEGRVGVVKRFGVVTLSWTITGSANNRFYYSRAYINGSPAAAQYSFFDAGTQDYSEDLVVRPGDRVSVYVWDTYGTASALSILNFRIKTADILTEKMLV